MIKEKTTGIKQEHNALNDHNNGLKTDENIGTFDQTVPPIKSESATFSMSCSPARGMESFNAYADLPGYSQNSNWLETLLKVQGNHSTVGPSVNVVPNPPDPVDQVYQAETGLPAEDIVQNESEGRRDKYYIIVYIYLNNFITY